MKYNTKLIWDFINGEFVPNEEKLEDDYYFMTKVIDISNDKNMIELCSERLKKDYKFIGFILQKFKDDKKLLEKIETSYINKLDKESPKYIELVFLLASLEENNNRDSIYLKYLIERHALFLKNRLEYEKIKEYNHDVEKKYGMGFALIKTDVLKKYYHNRIILDYYAKELIEEIFTENKNYNFEEMIHICYKSTSTIEKQGKRNLIINYISVYDKYLSDYVAANIHLIKDIEKRLTNIIDDYKLYEYKLLEAKNSIFEEKANKILESHNSGLFLEEVCNYIYYKMNISIPYYCEKCCDIEEVNYYHLSFVDKKCIREILKLSKEIYNKNTTKTKLDMMDRNNYVEDKYNNKVLRLNFE